MRSASQLILLQNKAIKWKNSNADVCVIEKIDKGIVFMKAKEGAQEIELSQFINQGIEPIIAYEEIIEIIQNKSIVWVDKEGVEYVFSSFYDGLIEFDSSQWTVELSIEEVYQKFGILKK